MDLVLPLARLALLGSIAGLLLIVPGAMLSMWMWPPKDKFTDKKPVR